MRASHGDGAGARARAGPPSVPRQRSPDEHERHVCARVSQLGQRPQRLVRIAHALDLVVTAVALRELGLDVGEDVSVLFDGDQEG